MTLTTPEGLDPDDVPLKEQVDVARMQAFSFDTRASQSQEWPIAVGIDATTWVSAVLVVAVHQINAWAAGTRLRVTVDPIDLDPDDPKQIFAGSSVATILLDSSTQPGTARIENLAPPWGRLLRVVARPSQAAVEASGAQTCTLSIRLVARRRGLLFAPATLLHRARDR